MKTRILSGLLMAPLLIIVYLGGKTLLFACLVMGVLGCREFFGGYRSMGVFPSSLTAYFAAAALYGVNLSGGGLEWYMAWLCASVFACLLYMFNVSARKPEDGAATLMGIMYVILFSFHVTLIEQTEGRSALVWLVFLTAFGTDIMAYFTGRAIGRHKLCPGISPKKTVEGAVGGLIGSVALCGAFGHFFAGDVLVHCLVIGAAGGVCSQLGDLTASVFKRRMGIKDYGSLIPGHGGILDRFDSVLFTAPMIYYYIALAMG